MRYITARTFQLNNVNGCSRTKAKQRAWAMYNAFNYHADVEHPLLNRVRDNIRIDHLLYRIMVCDDASKQ